MNNQQFRSLYKENGDDHTTPSNSESTQHRALGSKRNNDRKTNTSNAAFAQSVRDRSTFLQPTKRFKSSAPKGSKIASGFVDRAKERAEAKHEDEDDRTKQIKELEKQLKEKKISQSAFEEARDVITGGDISATHLVKGLDRKLLERIRQGEDVMTANPTTNAQNEDIDDELDKLESAEITQSQKNESKKQGTLAPSLVAGRKRTRDEIMAEMKAQRRAEAEVRAQAQPKLGDQWQTVGSKQTTRVETDKKGREVLVVVDEDGKVKKMLRKPAAKAPEKIIGRTVPGEVLGADVTIPANLVAAQPEDEDDDDDIFEGVGTEYDPLGADDDDSEAEGESAEHSSRKTEEPSTSTSKADPSSKERPRNYFKDKPAVEQPESNDRFSGVEAVIAKAARLASTKEEAYDGEHAGDAARRAKHAAMLNTRDRDMDDMDLGFGASRFEDGEDETASKGIRLSEWSDEKDDRKDKKDSKSNRKRSKK